MKDTVLINLIHLTHRVCSKVEEVFLRLVEKFFRRKAGDRDVASAYRTIAHLLRGDQVSEPMTRRFSRLGVRFPASFASALVNRSAKKGYRELPEWSINDKIAGRDFARRLSVKTPDMLQESVPSRDIEIASDTVIKPASGSSANGVYLVFDEHDMYEVASKQRLASTTALRKRLSQHTKQTGNDEWLVEACITNHRGEPAHDLKFYCFYGEVGVIVEIRRIPTRRFCWWSPDGRPIDVGHPEKLHFEGDGVSEEMVALAKRVSLEIPAPFVRIDFLNGRDGMYFGEFTPRPGGFDKFDKPSDRRLGHLFLEAEARLTEDLLHGKGFEAFTKSTTDPL
jgi:hypothetical protein